MSKKSSSKTVLFALLIILIAGGIVLYEFRGSETFEKESEVFDLPLIFPEGIKSPEQFREHIQTFTDNVYFGSYPHDDSFEILDNLGIQTIVTLMSEKENRIADYEAGEAKKYGIQIKRVYMPPKVELESKAIEEIQMVLDDIQENPDNRYYFHCFLGDHRVNYTKYYIAKKIGYELPDMTERIFDFDIREGKVEKVADNLYVGPRILPELYLYLLFGKVDVIVSLLDPGNEEHIIANLHNEKFCNDYGLECVNIPMDMKNFTRSENYESLKTLINNSDKVFYIHHWESEPLEGYIKRIL